VCTYPPNVILQRLMELHQRYRVISGLIKDSVRLTDILYLLLITSVDNGLSFLHYIPDGSAMASMIPQFRASERLGSFPTVF
jgi:hypothetical protein